MLRHGPSTNSSSSSSSSSSSENKRKHGETLDNFAFLSASTVATTLAQSPSSSRTTGPKKSTNKRGKRARRSAPRKKRQVLTLVPDGFTVVFCAFQHAWFGNVSYHHKNKVGKRSNRPRWKKIGIYKVAPVDVLGRTEPKYESDYCHTATSAFRQAYAKKLGEPTDGRRLNGRLFFGFHFIQMQRKLHLAFEHMYLGGTFGLGTASKTKTRLEERTLFDRWCGELSIRTGMLPWMLHRPLVLNAYCRPYPLGTHKTSNVKCFDPSK